MWAGVAASAGTPPHTPRRDLLTVDVREQHGPATSHQSQGDNERDADDGAAPAAPLAAPEHARAGLGRPALERRCDGVLYGQRRGHCPASA